MVLFTTTCLTYLKRETTISFDYKNAAAYENNLKNNKEQHYELAHSEIRLQLRIKTKVLQTNQRRKQQTNGFNYAVYCSDKNN